MSGYWLAVTLTTVCRGESKFEIQGDCVFDHDGASLAAHDRTVGQLRKLEEPFFIYHQYVYPRITSTNSKAFTFEKGRAILKKSPPARPTKSMKSR